MRLRTSALALAALALAALVLAAPAAAETRIFTVDSSDGYGIDRCLAAGDRCGEAAATAICRARAFVKAVDFGRVDPTEITGAVPVGARVSRCEGRGCPQTITITCAR
jgi:hypothetical protein